MEKAKVWKDWMRLDEYIWKLRNYSIKGKIYTFEFGNDDLKIKLNIIAELIELNFASEIVLTEFKIFYNDKDFLILKNQRTGDFFAVNKESY